MIKDLLILTLSYILSSLTRRHGSCSDIIHGMAGGVLLATWMVVLMKKKKSC